MQMSNIVDEDIETDIDVFSECLSYWQGDSARTKTSLKAIGDICHLHAAAGSLLRSRNVPEQILSLLFDSGVEDIQQDVFVCLTNIASCDKETQMEIACDSVFDLILYTLRNNSDKLLLRSAICLLISLVVDNFLKQGHSEQVYSACSAIFVCKAQSQCTARTSGCLVELLNLFRSCFPDDVDDQQSKLACAVCLAISKCVNMPQDAHNQRQAATILPCAADFLTKCSDSDLIGILAVLVRDIVFNNSLNEARAKTSGCVDALISKFAWLVTGQEEGKLLYEVTFRLVDAIDACIRDQKAHVEYCGEKTTLLADILRFINLCHLSDLPLIRPLTLLGHLTETCRENADKCRRLGGVGLLLPLLITTDDVDVRMTVRYILANCRGGSTKTNDPSVLSTAAISSAIQRITQELTSDDDDHDVPTGALTPQQSAADQVIHDGSDISDTGSAIAVDTDTNISNQQVQCLVCHAVPMATCSRTYYKLVQPSLCVWHQWLRTIELNMFRHKLTLRARPLTTHDHSYEEQELVECRQLLPADQYEELSCTQLAALLREADSMQPLPMQNDVQKQQRVLGLAEEEPRAKSLALASSYPANLTVKTVSMPAMKQVENEQTNDRASMPRVLEANPGIVQDHVTLGNVKQSQFPVDSSIQIWLQDDLPMRESSIDDNVFAFPVCPSSPAIDRIHDSFCHTPQTTHELCVVKSRENGDGDEQSVNRRGHSGGVQTRNSAAVRVRTQHQAEHAKKTQHRKKFSKDEERALERAVQHWGTQWATILHLYGSYFDSRRTPGQLKDKYRNLMKKYY